MTHGQIIGQFEFKSLNKLPTEANTPGNLQLLLNLLELIITGKFIYTWGTFPVECEGEVMIWRERGLDTEGEKINNMIKEDGESRRIFPLFIVMRPPRSSNPGARAVARERIWYKRRLKLSLFLWKHIMMETWSCQMRKNQLIYTVCPLSKAWEIQTVPHLVFGSNFSETFLVLNRLEMFFIILMVSSISRYSHTKAC